MLQRNEEECQKHKDDFDMGLSWFRSQVTHNGPWDIKMQEHWDEEVGVEFTVREIKTLRLINLYNGEVISAEDLGNITYGYWGTSMGHSRDYYILVVDTQKFLAMGIAEILVNYMYYGIKQSRLEKQH